MNDSHFETSLRAFRPSAPPAAIEERIAAGLSQPEPSLARKEREPVSIRFEQAREPLLIRCFQSLGWAIAGAASAVAAIALYPAKPVQELRPAPQTPAVQMSAPVARLDFSETRNLRSAPSSGVESSTALVSTVSVAAALPAGAGENADFQAVETTRELISTDEEGQVLYPDGNTPMRQVRNRYRERHSWTNPRSGARVEIEIPREDVFLKPVSLQ